VGCGVELGAALLWRAKPGRRWKAAVVDPCCGAGGGRRPVGLDELKGRVGRLAAGLIGPEVEGKFISE
jgi:hypothetical protein